MKAQQKAEAQANRNYSISHVPAPGSAAVLLPRDVCWEDKKLKRFTDWINQKAS
jgi:hypothetical protein